MDPLSETQLRILREAATPEGCRDYLPVSARRLLRLGLVEERGGVLFVTPKGRRYLLAQTWTPHERAAVALYAKTSNSAPEEFVVVREPQDGVWYDWADPDTGAVGQCLMERHTWVQEPGGENPVVLAWQKGRG